MQLVYKIVKKCLRLKMLHQIISNIGIQNAYKDCQKLLKFSFLTLPQFTSLH